MKRWTASFLFLAGLAVAGSASAQEARPAEGKVLVTLIPGGATFFTEGKDANGPSFGNYDLGGAVAGNFNRYIGVEGEISGKLGISQDLGAAFSDTRTPNLLNYSGNVIVNAPNHSAVTPYATGGVGAMTMFEKASLGINDMQTFLTSNFGGGIKWTSGRMGLRGDYRFIIVQSKDDAPAFWGPETRYGHRIYGAVTVNLDR